MYADLLPAFRIKDVKNQPPPPQMDDEIYENFEDVQEAAKGH